MSAVYATADVNRTFLPVPPPPQPTHHAEVCELSHQAQLNTLVVLQQHIVGLQVAVDHARRVEVLRAFGQETNMNIPAFATDRVVVKPIGW